MKPAFLFALLALIFIHLIFSLLAVFQANRFRRLSQSSPWIIWVYMIAVLLIDIAILAVFWKIEF